MNKFGTLKSKILQKLTEAYASGNKSEMKEILSAVSSNKDFRDMYLFYEDMESKHIEKLDEAKAYIEEVAPMLKEKSRKITKFCKELDKKLGDVTIVENKLYSNLDVLLENNTLKNVDKKIESKMNIVTHLMAKKEEEIPIISEGNYTKNETLLHAILTNNFNVLYGNTLNEEQKEELKKILSVTNSELEGNFKTLQEEVTKKMTEIYETEKSDELKTKISTALTEAKDMKISKYNYYKLQQLRNGL